MRMRKWGFCAVGFGLTALMLVFPACGRKKSPQSLSGERKTAAEAGGVLKELGLRLYPGAELTNQTVKRDKVQIPETDKPGSVLETKIITVEGVSGESPEVIQGYYAKSAGNVITEEKLNEKISFLQLSNVADINQAISQRVSPIVLINLRRKRLSEGERLAYKSEYESLKGLKKPDAVQRRRMTDLDRLLQEKTFIQIHIRVTS